MNGSDRPEAANFGGVDFPRMGGLGAAEILWMNGPERGVSDG
jgi:hypothetical protein